MAHRDTILQFLASSTGPVCDDCISARTGIMPRQTVNQACNRMATAGEIRRSDLEVCAFCRAPKICNHAGSSQVPPQVASPVAETDDHGRPWHWEGNVQARLVTHLASEGWRLVSAANTAAKSTGKDIVAERDRKSLWISVKGFPESKSRTHPATQARHWFSHAVFDVVMYRDEDASVELAIGLPAGYTTYENLAARVRWLRQNLPFSIYWVSESGTVRLE